MSQWLVGSGWQFAWHSKANANPPSAAVLRAMLLIGCAASVAIAASLGEPQAYLRADPELAVLLRGMAVIKAFIVMPALGVLWWRFGHPIARGSTLGYLVGAWLVASATALIWQLTLIALAALIFHVAGLALLLVALADRRAGSILNRSQVEPDAGS